MELNLDQPEPMVWTGNLSENWKRWLQRFQFYMVAKHYVKKEIDLILDKDVII